jgi:hypothetical protein
MEVREMYMVVPEQDFLVMEQSQVGHLRMKYLKHLLMVVRVAGTPELGEDQKFMVDLVEVEVEAASLQVVEVGILVEALVFGLVYSKVVAVVLTITELVNQISKMLEQVMDKLLLL